MSATTRRVPYIAAGPKGSRLRTFPNVKDYVEQLKNRDFPPNDVRINNKRLLFIYPLILSDDMVEDIFGDWDHYVIRSGDSTYVASQLVNSRGEPYKGGLFHFGVDVKGQSDILLPDVKTIFQSEWNHVKTYFKQYSPEDDGTRPEGDEVEVEEPDLVEEEVDWTSELIQLKDRDPDGLVHWYHNLDDRVAKKKLISEIEDARWLVVNSTDRKLIMDSVGDLGGLILDLGRTYNRDNQVYKLIQSLLDGRLIHDGKMVKFDPPTIIVLTYWKPDLSLISSRDLSLVSV